MKKKLMMMIAMLAIAGIGVADVIKIDFGYASTPDHSDQVTFNGEGWNRVGITVSDGANLQNTSGVEAATCTLSSTGAFQTENVATDFTYDWVVDGASMEDGMKAAAGETTTFTITGLTGGTAYNISMVSERNKDAFEDTDYKVNGVYSTGDASKNWNSQTSEATISTGYVFMEWSNIAVTSGGTLTITAASAAGERALINGLRIEAVPEPATVGMLGLGALVALLVRRIRA